MSSRPITSLSLTLLALLIAGCAAKEPKPQQLKSMVVAAEELNPNRRDRSQPVVVHLYYLQQDEAFLQASFRDLTASDPQSLGGDLLRHTQVLIGPGESQSLDQAFDPKAQYIGVVAAFTRIDDAQWRALVEVPGNSLRQRLNPFSGKRLEIALENTSVSAQIVKD
ncbi:MAG: type VI secretion system lipoprotein TssJ [Pseudomonadota bacterium]